MPWAVAAAAIGVVGSAVTASTGASAAKDAAAAQVSAADAAAQVQQNEFNTEQKNLAPYLQSGQTGNALLNSLMGITPGTAASPGTQGHISSGGIYSNGVAPGGWVPGTAAHGATAATMDPNAPLNQKYGEFKAPQFNALTAASFQQSPGYQYEMQQQQAAIQASAASRGGAIGGNTLEALQRNAQGLASQDWAQANQQNIANFDMNYKSQLSAYQQNYQGFNQNQDTLYNRLAAMSGSGQNAAAHLGDAGQKSADAIGGYLTQAGNATAAGQIGSASAFGGGVTNAGNALGAYFAQQQSPWSGGGVADTGGGW